MRHLSDRWGSSVLFCYLLRKIPNSLLDQITLYKTTCIFLELVDCDKMDQGCGGGLPENAYKALEKIGGLETESAYPYDGRNEQCHFDKSSVKAKVIGYQEISKNETEMAMWLLKKGPISIGINANAMQVRQLNLHL